MHISWSQSKDWTTCMWRATIPFMDVPVHFIFTGLSWGNKPGWDLICRRNSLKSSCCEACSFHGDVTGRKLGLSSCHINISTLLAIYIHIYIYGIPNFPRSVGAQPKLPKISQPFRIRTLGFADIFPDCLLADIGPLFRVTSRNNDWCFFGGVLKVDPTLAMDPIWDDLGYPQILGNLQTEASSETILGYSRKGMTVHDVQARISKKIIDVASSKTRQNGSPTS